MNALESALSTRLSGDTTLTTYGVTGVYNRIAKQGAVLPYLIFQKQSGVDTYTFTQRERRIFVYLIKGITEGYSTKVAGQIAERIDALLTDYALPIAGATLLYLRRESDVAYTEVADGKVLQHQGGLYRIEVDP